MVLAAKYVTAFDKPLLCHAIDPELDSEGYMHEGAVSARIGVPGVPAISEDIAVARDCIIAEYTGAHVHICTLPPRVQSTSSARLKNAA